MSARHSDSLPRAVDGPLAEDASTAATSLARLELVLDLLPNPVAVFDSALRLTRANPHFLKLTGLQESTVTGRHARDAFPSAAGDIAPLIAEMESGSARTRRIAFMLPEGPRLADVTVTPLDARIAGGGLLVFAADVTEQERAVAHEARARERRLAAVGQLAAGVMHDVNNALNPIVAAAYLLEVHADDAVAVRDYAHRIALAAETGAATAARVGRFIRQEPLQGGREELVDLDVVADEVVAMTRPVWAERMLSGGIELVRTHNESSLARGIAGEVREALLNLVQNALDAMPTGGTLGVVTGTTIEHSWVEVRDSGPGMTAEARERAFEPFYSTKGRQGTGLGLAEVYGIMKRHRGQAEIHSAAGTGTTVRLSFPRAAIMAITESMGAGAHRPQRVLIVEDHEDGREFMRAILASDGHTVVGAGGVREALTLFRSAHEPFDVLIADIGLPDGSGWDLVRDALALQPDLRVGIVTGWEPTSKPPMPVEFTLRKPVPAHALLRHVGGKPTVL